MPLLGTRGIASDRGFGVFTSTGVVGWAVLFTSASSLASYPYAIKVTSTGSYVVGLVYAYSDYVEYLVTINGSGTAITSETNFWDNANSLSNNVVDLVLDSTDNIYSVGRRSLTTCCSPSNYWVAISKTDSASSNIRSTYFGAGNTNAPYFSNIGKFSDGTILISGFTYSNNAWPAIVKLNSALTAVSWGLQKNSNVYLPVTTGIDGSDNILAFQVENSNSRLNILSITSAGSITYKKFLSGFSAYNWSSVGGQGAVSKPIFDASNNSYFTGNYFYSVVVCCTTYYYPRSMLLSLDSTSSTLRFAKGYVSSGGAIQGPSAIAKDSSGNMYFASYYTGAQGTGTIIIKTNSSGVLQWARTITQSTNSPTIPTVGVADIAIDGANFVLAASRGNGNGSIVLKMPTSGAGSGSSFVLGGRTYSYSTPTDFSVVDLTGLTISTDASSSWTSYAVSLTNPGIAPVASSFYTSSKTIV